MSKQTIYYALYNGKLVAISKHSLKKFSPHAILGQEMTLESERYTQVVDDIYYKHEDTQAVDDPTFVSSNQSDETSMMRRHRDSDLKTNDRLCFPKEPHINPSLRMPKGGKWAREQNLDKIIQISGDPRYLVDSLDRSCMIKVNGVLGPDVLESSGQLFMPTTRTVSDVTSGHTGVGVYRGLWNEQFPVVLMYGMPELSVVRDPESVGVCPMTDGADFVTLTGNAYLTATSRTLAMELDSNGEVINYYFLDAGTRQKVVGIDMVHNLAKLRLSNNSKEVIVGLDMLLNTEEAPTPGAPKQIMFDPEVPQYVQLKEDVDGIKAGTVMILERIEDDSYAYLRTFEGEQVDIPTAYLEFLNEFSSGVTTFDVPFPTLVVTSECNLQTSHTANTKKICRMAVSDRSYRVTGYAYRNGVMLFKLTFFADPPDCVSGSIGPEFEGNMPSFGWVSGRGVSVDEALWDDVQVTKQDGHNIKQYVGRYVTVTQDLGLVDEFFDPPRRAYITEDMTLGGVEEGTSQEVSAWSLVRITERHDDQYVGTVSSNDFEFKVGEVVFSSGKIRYEYVPTLEDIDENVWTNPLVGYKCGCTTSAVSEHQTVFKAMLENDNDVGTEDGVPDSTKVLYPNQLIYVLGMFTYGSYRYYAVRLGDSNDEMHYIQAFKLSLATKTATAPYTAYATVAGIGSYNDPYGTGSSFENSGEVGREIECLEVYEFSEPLDHSKPIKTSFGFIDDTHLSLGLVLNKTAYGRDGAVLVSKNPDNRLYVLGTVSGTKEAPVLYCSSSITDFADTEGLLEVRSYCELENCQVSIPGLDTPYTLSNVRVFTVYSSVRKKEMDIVTRNDDNDLLFDAMVMIPSRTYEGLLDERGCVYVIPRTAPLRKSPFSETMVPEDVSGNASDFVSSTVWHPEDNDDFGYFYHEGSKGWCIEGNVYQAWLLSSGEVFVEEITSSTAVFKPGVTSSEPKIAYCGELHSMVSPHGIGETLTASNLSEHLFTKRFTLVDYEGQSLDEYYIDQSGVAYNGIVVGTESEGYVPYDHAKYMWINRESSIASVYGNTLGASNTTFDKMSNGSFKVYNRTTQGFEEKATVTLPSAVFQILGEETYEGITYYKVMRMWSALLQIPLTFPFYITKDLTAFNYVSDDTYYSIRREISYIIMAQNTPQDAVVHYKQSVLSVVESISIGGHTVTYENPYETLFVVTRTSENSPSFYIDSYGFYRWEDFDGVAISDRLVAKEDSTELSSLVDDFSKAVYLDSPLAVDLGAYFANEPQDLPKGFDAFYNKAVPYRGVRWNNDVWGRGALQMTHHAVMKVTQTLQNPQRTVRWYFINDAGYVDKEGSTVMTSAWVYSIVSDQGLEGTMAPVEEYTKEYEWGTLDPPVEVVFLMAESRTGRYLPKLPNGISQPVMVSRTVGMPGHPFPYYFVEYDGQKIIIRPPTVSGVDYALTFRQEECDLYISPDRVHKTVFGCAYEFSDPYEDDLVSDVIRTRGYHCKRRLEADSCCIYQVYVYTRTPGTSEAVPVMAWCNGYEVRDVPLVQEFNVSGTLNNPFDIYMYNDTRTRVLGHDSGRSPQVTCLGRTSNGMVKVRYISMGQERYGYVLERNVTLSELIEPLENPERLTNPQEGHYTLRVLSYRPENDNQDAIANLWISVNDPELLSMVSQEAPTNVYPVYTDVTLEEVIDGLGKLSLKQQLIRCRAGAEFVIIDSTGSAIDLSSVDSPYSYTLQLLSFSNRSGCRDLFSYAVGIEDDDSSDMYTHAPCGVYSYINTTLELATQAFNSLESCKHYYDPRAVFCVLDKDGNMVLPVGGLYSVRLKSWDSERKVPCIRLITALNGSSPAEAKAFLNNWSESMTVPGLENITYQLALEKYNLAVRIQESESPNSGFYAVFDIIDHRDGTVYPTE